MTRDEIDCPGCIECGGVSTKILLLLGVAVAVIVALCAYTLPHGGPLSEKPKVTISAVVSRILLGERVPPDERIISLVRRETGSTNFDKKDLAWYKTKARQGKLRGQEGKPHVIDQKVARYHTVGRFNGGLQI